ncbi:MAG: hypothetical protein RLZZ84_1519, partial [Pseudomonadota bacterium]
MSARTTRRRAVSADRIVLCAAVLASLAVVWIGTRQPAAVAGFLGGIGVLGAIIWGVARPRGTAAEAEIAAPDWSVTVAAIDRADTAVAITDRAGRLVCANPRYEEWFGAAHAPPRLPVDNSSLERLARAGRSGWR